MPRKIDVDTKTFVRFWLVILAFVILLWFLAKAAPGLLVVAIAVFLALAIHPLAEWFDLLDRKKKRPKLTSVIAYILVIGVIGFIVSVIGPVVVEQTTQLLAGIPSLFRDTLGGWDGINHFGESIGIENLQQDIYNAISSFSSSVTSSLGSMIFGSISTVAGVVTSTILVLVLTLLFLLEGPSILEGFWKSLKAGRSETERRPIIVLQRVVSRMSETVSTYVSRQVAVALLDGCVVATTVFVLSLIFQIPAELALPLGMFAMIFFLIPMFGPIISCITISAVLAANSLWAGLSFLIFYILYEQIANNIIAPKLQGNALKLPASLILVAVTIGTYMFGLFGAIISIPIAGCIKVLVEEYPRIRMAGRSEIKRREQKELATGDRDGDGVIDADSEICDPRDEADSIADGASASGSTTAGGTATANSTSASDSATADTSSARDDSATTNRRN